MDSPPGMAAVFQQPDVPSPDPDLCEQCLSIDFDGPFSRLKSGFSSLFVPVADLSSRSQIASNYKCRLCRLFAEQEYPTQSVGLANFDGAKQRVLARRSEGDDLGPLPIGFESSWGQKIWTLHLELVGRDKHCTLANSCIVVCRNDSLPVPNVHGWPIRPSTHFEPSTARRWLDYCHQSHESCCTSTSSPVQGLNLIDCHSLAVNIAPKVAKYVALSYVWGIEKNTAAVDSFGADGDGVLPKILPRVVSDAITVASRLGYKYLWVDKYCINHNNPSKKHEQIKQMDKVYENADLTIIAAAGNNQNHGLPGVSTTPRKQTTVARIGDHHFMSQGRRPEDIMKDSEWNSRGWTYQEALCSRRRLVFFDHQLYFECNNMAWLENIQFSPAAIPQEDDTEAIANFGNAGLSRMWRWSGFDSIKAYYNLRNINRFRIAIGQYSVRRLRYDEDTLTAFSGIMSRFRRLEDPVLETWGLPFPDTLEADVRYNEFVISLLWSPLRVPVSRRRRPVFPSWSWAGWYCNEPCFDLQWGTTKSVVKTLRFCYSTTCSSQNKRNTDGHNVMTLFELDNQLELARGNLADTVSHPPNVLWLESCSIPYSSIKIDVESEEIRGLVQIFGMNTWIDIPRDTFRDEFRSLYTSESSESEIDRKKWHFLWIADEETLNLHHKHKVLLLKEVGDGVYSREGVLTIDEQAYNWDEEDPVLQKFKRSWTEMVEDKSNWRTFLIE